MTENDIVRDILSNRNREGYTASSIATIIIYGLEYKYKNFLTANKTVYERIKKTNLRTKG